MTRLEELCIDSQPAAVPRKRRHSGDDRVVNGSEAALGLPYGVEGIPDEISQLARVPDLGSLPCSSYLLGR